MSETLLTGHVVIPDHVVSRPVGDATVLLNAATGQYFTLDSIGARIWTLLAADGSLRAVYERLCAEFEADPDDVRRDLAVLVERLQARGLLDVSRVE
jgi:Coenzyme PQQ synthesis protein D (PqqD)